MRRTVDGGRSWIDCRLPEAGVFSLAASSADGAIYAGTEPSRLFRSDDRGESWRELESLPELAWLLHRPGVTAPIIGATKLEHLEQALAATELELAPGDIARLEEPHRPHPVLGHY